LLNPHVKISICVPIEEKKNALTKMRGERKRKKNDVKKKAVSVMDILNFYS